MGFDQNRILCLITQKLLVVGFNASCTPPRACQDEHLGSKFESVHSKMTYLEAFENVRPKLTFNGDL